MTNPIESTECGCKIVIYESDFPYIEYCPTHAQAFKMREALERCYLVLESLNHAIGPYKQHPLYVIGTNEAIEMAKKALSEIKG